MTTILTRTMSPVFCKKSPKVRPRAVPMMMLGGSPLMVAAPPRFAVKISAMMSGTGSNFSSRASWTLATARNRMTVMLSMNMDSTADKIIKQTSSGTGR